MARKVRLEYRGAVYHVMCRGDRREAIFRSDKDRWLFLDTLAEACERSGMLIHSYVLMLNHYHLLLETPDGNLVAGMRWLQSTYTARFNARHGLSGHLFQGRYKAIPVDTERTDYFRAVSDYIHLNPARARLLDPSRPRLGAYPWSSFRALIGRRPLPAWLTRARVFWAHDLASEDAASRRRYAMILERAARESAGGAESDEQRAAWARVRQGWALGDERFRERLQGLVGRALRGRQRGSFVGDEPIRKHDRREAERLLEAVSEQWGKPKWERLAANDPMKQVAAWLLRSRTTVGGIWVAARLTMGHVSNVSRAHRAVVHEATPDIVRLKRDAMRICKD